MQQPSYQNLDTSNNAVGVDLHESSSPPSSPSFFERLATLCTGRNIIISGAALAMLLVIILAAWPSRGKPSSVVPTPSPANNPNLVPVLVLADIHLDLNYTTGQPTKYCRKSDNQGTQFWVNGTYGCDSPLSLLVSALENAQTIVPCQTSTSTSASASASASSTTPCTRYAAVVVVGDLTVHERTHVNISLDVVFAAVNTSLATIRRYFPSPMPLLITIGNNDVYPDYNAPSMDELAWRQRVSALYDQYDVQYDKAAFLQSGFSSTQVPLRTHPGAPVSSQLRVISLNTVLYSFKNPNFNTSDPDPDPAGQFSQLTQALNTVVPTPIPMPGPTPAIQRQRALLFGHIAPGLGYYNGTIQMWNQVYIATFQRLMANFYAFAPLSVHMMFAHQHEGGFRLFPASSSPSSPSSSSSSSSSPSRYPYLLTPSLSPIYLNNPGFRVVYFSNDANADLIDFEEYFLNLTAAQAQSSSSSSSSSATPTPYPWDVEFVASSRFALPSAQPLPNLNADTLINTLYPSLFNSPPSATPASTPVNVNQQMLDSYCLARDVASTLRSEALQCCRTCADTLRCLIVGDTLPHYQQCLAH